MRGRTTESPKTEIDARFIPRLGLKFARLATLPHFRGCALRLAQELDNPASNASTLEATVVGDPGLTVRLLQAAASLPTIGRDAGDGTIRSAIMRLGTRATRTIALSLAVQGVVVDAEGSSFFDPQRFARHSLCTGLVAADIYRKLAAEDPACSWQPEEVMAVGILHDLAYALLWRVEPELFQDLCHEAADRHNSVELQFYATYGTELCELSAMTMKAWKLPSFYAAAMRGMRNPHVNDKEFALFASLHLGECLAKISGSTKSNLDLVGEPPRALQEATGIDDQEAVELAESAVLRVDSVRQDAQLMAS